jgi:hypothetical protein
VIEFKFISYFLHCVKHLNANADLNVFTQTTLFFTRARPCEAPADIISRLYTSNKWTTAEQIFKKCEMDSFVKICQAISVII